MGQRNALPLGRSGHATWTGWRRGSRRRSYLTAAFALLAVMMGSNIASPLYPSYRVVFGLTPLRITLIFGTYLLVIVPGLFVLGPLADAIGRRPVLLFGLSTSALGSATLAAAQGVVWLFAGRAILGVGFAAVMGAATAALFELEPHADGEAAAVVATSAFLGGAALGPLVAGLIAEYSPHPLVLPYLVHIGLVIVALAGVSAMMEPLSAPRRRPWRPTRPHLPTGTGRLFFEAGGAGSTASVIGALFIALVPSYMVVVLHSTNIALEGLVVALFLASGAVAQIALRRVAAAPSVATGLGTLAVGMALSIIAGAIRLGPLLILGAMVAGAGQGLTLSGALTLIADLAPSDRRAEVISTYYAVVYLASLIAIVLLGAVADRVTLFTAVFGFAIVVCMPGLVLAVSVLRRRHIRH